MVLFLIHLTSLPGLLIKILILLSLAQVALLLGVRPYKDKSMQKFEVYNELTVLVSCHLHHLFLVELKDATVNYDMKALLGWLTILNVSQNIILNLVILGIDSLKTLWAELWKLKK